MVNNPAKMFTVRGNYKKQELPEDLIGDWVSEDMGGKVIATRLRAEHDIAVSYKRGWECLL